MSHPRRVALRDFLANVPIPEPVIAALLVGLALRYLAPVRLRRTPGALQPVGGGLVLGGSALIVWSTAQARDMRIAEPDRLLTHGPYTWSRNPMYVGWIGTAAGLGLGLNSVWLLLTTFLAFIHLHSVEIPAEEAKLAGAFDRAYAQYRDRVPRYGGFWHRRAATR